MSLRYQQYAALAQTRDFLRRMFQRPFPYKTIAEMRENARQCLHHYPRLYESGQPMWSRDDYTEDADA